MDVSPMSFNAPPEFYADGVKLTFSPYGFTFEFGLQTNSPGDLRTQAIVRMSPQHALVYYQFLKRQLKEYETQFGKIMLPDALFAEFNLEKEI